ncbi:hypothetical protein [Nostoc sp.]|uniref:hypothetical protein n=1 Tax=Nostoc sp. TaxID=1180 RepID=UPI002FF6E148
MFDDQTALDIQNFAKRKLLAEVRVVASDKLISQAQATRLWTIARVELKLQDSEVRAVFAEYGIASTKFIPAFQYDEIMNRLAQCAKAEF